MEKLIDMEQVVEDVRNAQEDINKTLQRLSDKHKDFEFDPDCSYTIVTRSDGKSHRYWTLSINVSLELNSEEGCE